MPKVLILHTGGTLMMRGGDPSPLAPDVYTSDLFAELPVLRKVAEIESRILFNLDSSNMQPHHWVELAADVHASLPKYDGVVVVHGTDTMAYTASALAFLLPGIDRPVVLTGAQRPLVEVRTDARANLVDACMLATMPIAEVGIAFGSKLLRGCRSSKLDAWGMNAFASPSCAPLAELGVTVEIAPHVLAPRPPTAFDPRIEPRVLAVRAFPGLDPRLLIGALRVDVKGIVLEAFGAGDADRLVGGTARSDVTGQAQPTGEIAIGLAGGDQHRANRTEFDHGRADGHGAGSDRDRGSDIPKIKCSRSSAPPYLRRIEFTSRNIGVASQGILLFTCHSTPKESNRECYYSSKVVFGGRV